MGLAAARHPTQADSEAGLNAAFFPDPRTRARPGATVAPFQAKQGRTGMP